MDTQKMDKTCLNQNNETKKNVLGLSEKYYLVVGDRFELFYRGVIKMHNPYRYYVKATCPKGYTYNRYFTYTPKDGEEGNYPLKIALYDDEGTVICEKETTLVVEKPKEINRKVNVLCFGDSLTVNGVWPSIGFEKYDKEFPGLLNFIGKSKKVIDDENIVGYEGYGGWQWKTFCFDNDKSPSSSVWVKCNHNKTDLDQHSVWECDGRKWVLETIEEDRLKFKRGLGNSQVNPVLGEKLTYVEHGENTEDIYIDSYEYSDGNPFWNKVTGKVDFKDYVTKNNFGDIDYVFILLTWNGQYIPYNKDFSIHDEYSSVIIDQIHKDFPNAKIGLMGIQLPCPNGGITACYGADGYYHDWYGETITAFNYNEFLEEKCKRDKYKDYVEYFDIKAQFDAEYNYWVKDMPVNNRNPEITERIGTNGIHPNLCGYNQFGDAFYRALVYMLNKYN